MITLETDRLVFRFPEVHADAKCTIEFQRTLRIPNDGKDYPLRPVSERSRSVISTISRHRRRRNGTRAAA
jgi:hypothetical protein